MCWPSCSLKLAFAAKKRPTAKRHFAFLKRSKRTLSFPTCKCLESRAWSFWRRCVSSIPIWSSWWSPEQNPYLVKPFQVDASVVSTSLARALHKKRLEQEVENYRHHLEEMVAEQTQQLREALREVERSYEHTLEALGVAIDLRDSSTAGHSRRVFLYSIEIGKAMGGLEHELKNIAMGAWLHDIGKLAIPDAILLKPGSLTDEERQVMQRHVQIGYDLVKGIPFLSNAAEIILGHHERCDGSGYPRGLKAEEIPVGARIFAVADTFDAMTSDRPYRRALPFAASREVIERGAGKQYDAHVARVFLSTPDETWQEIRRETAAIQVFSVAAADDIQALSRLVKPGS
ncbi:MAG: two-component system response regulator [Acidobacteria bacterium]|nr:MAG: two-component system response regulator [Acidobacteriota bacterium]